MSRAPSWLAAVAAAIALCALAAGCSHEERFAHGRFSEIVAVRPSGEARSVALLLSGRDGWTLTADHLARRLARDGALVIGVVLPAFYAELEKDIGDCEFTDGDLENLSHFVQAYYKLPGYTAPILVGVGEGAGFAYANLAQAPANTFAGALTRGFTPRLALKQELCSGEALVTHKSADGFELDAKPRADWTDLPARTSDRQLRAAYARLAAAHGIVTPQAPPELAGLPIVEVPAQAAGSGAAGESFAVLWSGDGGWAGLDEEVAAALASRGVPVAGVDSLRYFWTARTPESTAADLARIVDYYGQHWRRGRVLLIGYSQGADILPATLNRLPPAVRSRIALAAAMGLGERALFEFHLSHWVRSITQGYATLPEVRKLRGFPFLCIYGSDEDDTVCPKLKGPAVRVVELPGGHHFNGDYDRLAQEILKAAGTAR